MIPVISGSQPFSFSWLWTQHNEHRIVLPKLLFLLVLRLGRGDYRWLVLVNLISLSFVAVAFGVCAACLRGRVLISDAFFPLILLDLGEGGLRWSFQLPFASATVLACSFLIISLQAGPRASLRSAIARATCLILLPLCGGTGLLYAAILSTGTMARAVWQLSELSDETRRSLPSVKNDCLPASVAFFGAVGGALVVAVYFIGYVSVRHPWPAAGVRLTVRTFFHLLPTAFGPVAEYARFWLALALATLCVLQLVILARTAFRSSSEEVRFRALILVLFFAASAAVLLAIGYGRGARGWELGLVLHYSNVVIPFVATIYVCATFLEGTRFWVAVQYALFAASAICAVCNDVRAIADSRAAAGSTRRMENVIRAGTPAQMIAATYARVLYSDAPDAKEVVESGIVAYRNARFARYGAVDRLVPQN